MSLSFKTPGESFTNFLSQKHTEAISTINIDRLASTESRLAPFFSYHLSDRKKQILTEWGIYLSPFCWEAHSHAACKTIENELLFNSIYHFVHNNPSSSFVLMSLRDSKFQTFKGLFPKPRKKDMNNPADPILDRLCNFNRCITVKDSFRYGIDRKTQLKDCLSLQPELKQKNYIIHDEIHYWSPSDLNKFIVANEPNSIIATLVHPVEIELGFKKSMLPEIYEYTIRENSVFFFPDGNKSEFYEQPLEAGWWLHCKQFNSNGEKYGVSVLRSLGPFHLILIKKNCTMSETKRFFTDFSCVSFSKSFKMRGPDFSETRLRGNVFRKIVRYVLSLKKPDKESVMAKLRMMDDESKELDESLLCAKITQSLLKDKSLERFDTSVIDWLFDGLKNSFPELFQMVFCSDYFRKKTNLEILMHLKELEVEISTMEIDPNYNHCRYLKRLNSIEPENPVEEDEQNDMIRNMFNKESSKSPTRAEILFGKASTFYHGVPIKERVGPDTVFSWNTKIQYSYMKEVFILDNDLYNPKDKAGVYYMSEELESNLFWSDPIRVKAAQELSLEEARRKQYADELYHVVREKDMVDYRKGYKIIVVPTWWARHYMHEDEDYVKFLINFSLYSFKNQLTMTPEGVKEKEMDELLSRDPLDYVYVKENAKKHQFSSEQQSDNEFIVNQRIPEAQVVVKSMVPDGVCIEGLKNACCFLSLMKAKNWNQEELLSHIPDGDFIRKLFEDKGLFVDEFANMLEKMEINYVFKNSSDNIIKEKRNHKDDTLIFEVTDDHCSFAGKMSQEENTSDCYLTNSDLCGGNILLKSDCIEKGIRVEKLIESFIKGNTGVMIKEKVDDVRSNKVMALHAWKKLPNKQMLKDMLDFVQENNTFAGIFGAAGSGKSHRLISEVTNGRFAAKRTLFVSPRKILMESIKAKVSDNKNVECCTFEKLFMFNYLDVFDIFVFDELSLYPPGFIDLASLTCSIPLANKNPKNQIKKENLIDGRMFFLIGDFAQMRYHGEMDSPRLDKMDEIDYNISRAKNQIRYLNYSFRVPKNSYYNFGHENLGVEVEIKEPRFFINCQAAKNALPESQVLVASMDECNKFKNFDAKTFGMVQGMTLSGVLICLSPATLSSSYESIYVAFSRSTGQIDFFFNGYSSRDEFLERTRGSCLQGLLAVWKFDFTQVAKKNTERITKKKIIFESRKGVSQLDIELKLEGDPYLKSYIPLFEPIISYVEPCLVPNVDPANPKIHLPIWEKNNYCAEVMTRMKNRELREFRTERSMSEQFPDFFKKGEPQSALPNPCRFQAIYPKHSNSDSLTFFAAVKKRLKFSCPAKEREKFENVIHLGEEMFRCFLEKVPINPEINRQMMEDSVQEYVQKKVSKSGPTIASHVGRSDPDWGKHEIFLFIKTQLCTKYEKRFCDAKAGQTLACFAHKLLNRFAAPCRYLEKKLQEAMPKRFYIHQKKDFNQLNDWVIEADFSGVCTESDYEAFDSSQDALILAMEYALLKYIQWDRSLINDYLDMKFNLGCRLGNLAVMRFTGEFGTFILNTVCNMSFTFMTYEVNERTHIAFAGDDMCANTNLRRYGTDGPFEHILSKLTLKAKVSQTLNPTFCGWRLTKCGLYKRPELILERLLISEEKGTFHETLDGYLLEFSYAYKLGEWLFESFSEKEFQAHYICTRLFVKNRKKISKSLQCFVDKIVDPDLKLGKCQLSKSMNLSNPTTQERKGLTVCTQMQSIRTPDLHQMSSLMSFKGMKVQSLSRAHGTAKISSLEYPLCIKTRLIKKEERANSSGSTLEQYQYLYTSWVITILNQQREQCLLLTAERGVEDVLLKHMTLISQKNQLTSYSRQTPTSISMMKCCLEHAKSMYLSMKTFMQKDQGHLELSLVLFLGLRMHSTAFIRLVIWKVVSLAVIIRLYSTRLVGTLESMKSHIKYSMKNVSGQGCTSLNQVATLKQLKGRRKDSLLSEPSVAQANIWTTTLSAMQMGRSPNQGEAAQLGQAELDLKIVVHPLDKLARHQGRLLLVQMAGEQPQGAAMSIRDWIYKKDDMRDPPTIAILKYRRRMLLRNHFVAVLRNQLGIFPVNPNAWTELDIEMWDRAGSMFAAHVFGNLAVYGFSEVTIYPPIEVTIEVDIGEPLVRRSMSAKLNEIKHQFKYYADNSNEPYLSNLTWRQIGESFAEDIKMYLKELQPTVKTWLASSNPALARGAPWVAIDVTRGLYKNLSPQEELVIARTNNHLLKTQRIKSSLDQSSESFLES